MDIRNLVLSDEAMKIIDAGTWVRDIEGAPGLELLVCGMESQDAQRSLTAKQVAQRAKNGGKPLTAEQIAACVRETLAEVVLKDWRGLDSGGEPVAYDKDQAFAWITSRNGDRFAGVVLSAAKRIDDEAGIFAEAVTKN